MKRLLFCIGLIVTLTLNSANAKDNAEDVEFTQAQLAQMLAPIALYPDSLLTHILIAATYPIEVVEAERWVSKNSDLSSESISKKVDKKDWEPSVKALVMFPKILERLSDDLSWTQQLGDAFLQSEEDVLQVIQDLRYQAQEAGSLDKMENVEVSREKKNIIIQPIQKEVVYVPYYDSRYVYGDWNWSMNPPIHWDWGHRVSLSRHHPFGWHSGIHISLNYFFSDFHWNNRHVVVVDHRNTHRYRAKKHIVRSGYADRWVHNPRHRRGVTYRTDHINKRFGSHRPVVHKTVVNQHNRPKLYPHKKDYRNNQHAVQKPHVVKHVKTHNNAAHTKLNKHEVLTRKFKERNVSEYRKPNHVVSHDKANTTHKQQYRADKPRKLVVDKKEYSSNRVTNKTYEKRESPSIRVQHRTEKPVFKTQHRSHNTQRNNKAQNHQRATTKHSGSTRQSHSRGEKRER